MSDAAHPARRGLPSRDARYIEPRSAVRAVLFSACSRRQSLTLEGRDDGTWSSAAFSAGTLQALKGITSKPKLSDPAVQRFDPTYREFAGTRSIRARIEGKQFPYLLKREAGALCLPDEPEATKVVGPIASNSRIARRGAEKPAPLIEADGLHSHTPGFRQTADREGLTLYHGTGAI